METRLMRARAFLLGRMKGTMLRVAPLALLAAGTLQASTVTATGPVFGAGDGSMFSSVINTVNGQGVKFFGSANPNCSSLCMLQFDFHVSNDGGPLSQMTFEMILRDPTDVVSWSFNDGDSIVYASGNTDPSAGASVLTGGALVHNGTVRFQSISSGFGDGFLLTVPQDSIDFTPLPGATAPEPATLGSMLASIAALAALRRNKR